MPDLFYGTRIPYSLTAYWGARKEDAETIAGRLNSTFGRMARISPSLNEWLYFDDPARAIIPRDFADLDDITRLVTEGKLQDRADKPGSLGYRFAATTKLGRVAWKVTMEVHAGCDIADNDYLNTVRLYTEPLNRENQDFITSEVMKPVVRLMAEVWEPAVCILTVSNLSVPTLDGRQYSKRWLRSAWMAYVAPHLVPAMQKPPVISCEAMPDGGVLMVATEERCTMQKHHLPAMELGDALLSLDGKFWPGDVASPPQSLRPDP